MRDAYRLVQLDALSAHKTSICCSTCVSAHANKRDNMRAGVTCECAVLTAGRMHAMTRAARAVLLHWRLVFHCMQHLASVCRGRVRRDSGMGQVRTTCEAMWRNESTGDAEAGLQAMFCHVGGGSKQPVALLVDKR